MSPDTFQNAFILTGPTGSGKSALALELAEALGAEILAMDSMTLYRGMDVGTAKPTPEERRRVRHHLLDVLDPWESASVAWWLKQAADCVRDVEARGRRALFVGGTPLYLKALLYGLFEGPPADESVRIRLTREADAAGPHALHARLAAVDPAGARRLHPNDVRRVVRALEVWELTGRPMSEWQTQWRRGDEDLGEDRGSRIEDRERTPGGSFDPPSSILDPRPRCLALDLPRDVLYARINARVERMVAGGLVEEVRALRAAGRPLSREARQALGYKEVLDHLDGKLGLGEAVRRIQTRTRHFAKRQLTWFRHLAPCRMVRAELTFDTWGVTIERGSGRGASPAR
jgi:tRNA dimethylallyltransferase